LTVNPYAKGVKYRETSQFVSGFKR